MFILYQDLALLLRENIYGTVRYIHHGDTIGIFNGKETEKYDVRIHDNIGHIEIEFFKLATPFNINNNIICTPSEAYTFLNQDKTFDSLKYSYSELARVWMLYSVERQAYYYEGDTLYISSRSMRLNEKKVIFSKVYAEPDKTKVILVGENNEQYEIFNSNYNGVHTPIEDLNNGIPFYTDIHCESKTYMSPFGIF